MPMSLITFSTIILPNSEFFLNHLRPISTWTDKKNVISFLIFVIHNVFYFSAHLVCAAIIGQFL